MKAPSWLISATLLLAIALPAWAQPTSAPGSGPLVGRWVVTEGGEDLEAILEMTDTGGWLLDGSRFHTVTVDAGSTHPEYLLRTDEEEAPHHFVFSGDGEAFLFKEGDNDLLRAYRVGELPAELEGQWEMAELGSGGHVSRLFVGVGGTLAIGEGGVDVLSLMMLSIDGQPALAVLERGSRVDGEVYRLVALSDDAFLLVEVGEDDAWALYRPGAAPESLGPLPEFAAETVCQLAVAHYRECLTVVCSEREHPACDFLDQDMPPMPDCSDEIREASAEMLEMPCDSLIPPMP